MKKHLFRVYLVTVVLMSSSGVLTGCMLCFDCRQKLQDMWLTGARIRIEQNQNMYAPYWANKNKNPRFMGSTTLHNGNIEDQYYDGLLRNKVKCHYFYEYEPKSGLIVNFRFEEKEKYDCRATGA